MIDLAPEPALSRSTLPILLALSMFHPSAFGEDSELSTDDPPEDLLGASERPPVLLVPELPPVPEPPSRLPQATTAADGLYVEFGEGVKLTDDDSPFALTIRGRVQTRATGRTSPGGDNEPDIFFQVRRARLVLLGELADQHLELYVQLGVGGSDVEDDRQVPLRDGVITWRRFRDASVRVGQMKVPFSRQRMVSSSALQLVDRSAVTGELNLDRDVGLQLYSNDLFGVDGALAYQVGVFGGEGRNRAGEGSGLLYVGRVQVQPLGGFSDTLTEADLTRSKDARLSIGAAAGINFDSHRARSSHGAILEEGYDIRHAAADIMFKWSGWSVQAEATLRDVEPTDPDLVLPVDAVAPLEGWGLMVQTGYLFATGYEVAGRYERFFPDDSSEWPLPDQQQVVACLGRYFNDHDLKLQGDYGLTFVDGVDQPGHEARVQLQFYF